MVSGFCIWCEKFDSFDTYKGQFDSFDTYKGHLEHEWLDQIDGLSFLQIIMGFSGERFGKRMTGSYSYFFPFVSHFYN